MPGYIAGGAAGSAVIIEGTAEAVATHNADTTAVHGITDTAALVVTTDSRLTDARTPAASSIIDSMIASTLSPSKITGTAAILGANTFTSAQTVAVSGATPLTLQRTDAGATPHLVFKNSAGTTLGQMREGSTGTLEALCRKVQNEAGTHTSLTFVNGEARVQGETSAANVLLVTSAMAAQTGNHFEARNSAGTVLASISAAGAATFAGSLTTSVNMLFTGNADSYVAKNSGNGHLLLYNSVASKDVQILVGAPGSGGGVKIMNAAGTATYFNVSRDGGIGFWGTTPALQPTAVADATDAASVITQLNALLARLRTIGIIAT